VSNASGSPSKGAVDPEVMQRERHDESTPVKGSRFV